MLPTWTPTHPIFPTRDQSRSYLTWARRLAQAEAFFMLLGSCSAFDASAGSGGINPYAIVGAALAILLLTLGYFVGRGSARAAIILVGLSIARQVLVFLPGASEFWRGLAPFILLDLFIFTQAARGAVALSRPATASPVAAAVVAKPSRPVTVAGGVRNPGFKWPVEWSEPPVTESAARTSIWAPNFSLDFIVASALVAAAMAFLNMAFTLADTSGVGALLGLFDLAYATFTLAVATLLFAAAYGAKKGKSWAVGTRAVAYAVLVMAVLAYFGL